MAQFCTKVAKICLSKPMKEINIKILKDELRDLQEALNEQLVALINYDGKLPRIEFDIIMENLRRIYDTMNKLYRLNDPDEKIKSFPLQGNTIPSTEKKPERTVETRADNTTQIAEKKIEPKKPQEEAATASLFSFEDLGFTQKLQEAREKSMGARSGQSKSGDLKSLININDKFLFINELFDGNLRDYSIAIEKLNSIKEKTEAFGYLTELMKQNVWNSQSNALTKLTGIIEKWFV
jgi:hypothetical protein